MNIHGICPAQVWKTRSMMGNRMYRCIPTGWVRDSILVMAWSLFTEVRAEVTKMAAQGDRSYEG